jgi:hypothetical protein
MSVPRVCAVKECGRDLLKKDGTPDYSGRLFCGPSCRNKDKARRIQALRATVGAKKKAEVRERAVAQTLPQRREWYVVRGVRIGVFSAQAFQYFEKHPDLVFARPKLVKALVVEPQKKKARR